MAQQCRPQWRKKCRTWGRSPQISYIDNSVLSHKKVEIATEESQDGVVADALMVRLDCRIIDKTLGEVADADTGTSDTGTPGTSTPDTGVDTATAGSSDNERSISDGSYAAVVEIHSASHHTSHSDEPCEGETSQ